jgi:ATP synthase protein I
MSSYLNGRAWALRAVVIQLLLALLMSAAGFAFNHQIAISLLLGGMIGVLANTWLALVAFRPALGQPGEKMLMAFYLGEFGKWLITLLLFLLVFKHIGFIKEFVHTLLMLLAYVITQIAAWWIAYTQRQQ